MKIGDRRIRMLNLLSRLFSIVILLLSTCYIYLDFKEKLTKKIE